MVDLVPAVGGVVRSFRAGGTPVFREGPAEIADANDGGCYPLVPFSNRVRDGRFTFRGREVRLSPNLPPQKHPLHGQGWRGAWSVETADEDRAVLVFDHAPGEWPWAYQARQTFRLDPGGLSIGLSCRNLSPEPMPCGLGLHPYFPAGPETVLSTEATGVWTIDEEVMPVALEPPVGRYGLHQRRINGADLDNGYEGWSGWAELREPEFSVRITSPDARRFQVYAPPEGGIVVAEPVVNANAALNQPEDRWPELGLTVLNPGDSTAMSARFDLIRAKDSL
ncbi:MAG: aldose 1-epimerase [Proteobacteria bacterium]|nr:aldose 1-epimerase [Pseudomonadota bacterium]